MATNARATWTWANETSQSKAREALVAVALVCVVVACGLVARVAGLTRASRRGERATEKRKHRARGIHERA